MNAKEEADKLRSEAKKLFLDLFSLRKPDIERIVDCIIGAAFLEVAALQQAAQQSAQSNDTPWPRNAQEYLDGAREYFGDKSDGTIVYPCPYCFGKGCEHCKDGILHFESTRRK